MFALLLLECFSAVGAKSVGLVGKLSVEWYATASVLGRALKTLLLRCARMVERPITRVGE